MKTQVFHVHALSAVHVGVGQAIGVVDLPIMRSKATHLPLIPGSALKGVLRDELKAEASQKEVWFGPESITNSDDSFASAMVFGDAHLLLMPVRSLAGVCALATCPFILRRYALDHQQDLKDKLPAVPTLSSGQIALSNNTVLTLQGVNKVVLEDLDLTPVTTAQSLEAADAWATVLAKAIYANAKDNADQQDMSTRIAILSDDDFCFLADTATEIRARIRINDETGTVKKGALWYEENLPAESVLWGVMAAGPSRHGERQTPDDVMTAFKAALGQTRTLQIGGKATVGRGLVRLLA